MKNRSDTIGENSYQLLVSADCCRMILLIGVVLAILGISLAAMFSFA
jgi:hypothetical protein